VDMDGPNKKPANVMEIIKIRRSVRKYADSAIRPDEIELLADVAREGGRALGVRSPLFLFVFDPEIRRRLSRAIFSGWFGKINPWVLTTKAPGFIVACGRPDRAALLGDKPLYLAETAMVMELVVLAAAELGLGTCWLGGFGEEGVKKALGLEDEIRVVAVSPLGRPPDKIGAASWDYMARNLVSNRRVALDKIVSVVNKQ
jgi:nitroreductase